MNPVDPEFYFDLPEPTSPSVDDWQNQCDKNGFHYCSVCDRTFSIPEGLVAQLRGELKLRNQDIEALQRTNRNLSRKIVEDRKQRELMKGIHGS